ncbi:MAG TPA: MMPL family transporter [Fervidobacterium sp.]|nr:MMPL family transporter [Fervidobacterium sp.]HPT54497.1 MMPL family transporter [Fervidobacterium sp.]HPZ17903.1 MMPL family transporter [Fervidobacterium sp.]HQE48769.1 MMPL family transporter [Fervidobacterium sp.]HUM42794.1 MMPL family transporter [Fervidobacterium sp.]
MARNSIARFFDKVYNYKFTIISLLLLILSLVIIVGNAKIETRIETFLPGYKAGKPMTEIDNPALQNEIKMESKFGDSTNISIIYESYVPLDTSGALSSIRTIQEKIEKMDNVKMVISVLNYPGASMYVNNDAVDFENLPPSLKSFVSNDKKYAMLLTVLNTDAQDESEVEAIVRKITNNLKDEPVIVISEASVNNKLFDELQRSMFFYPSVMFLVILAIFYYQTRSVWAAVVSLFIPILSSLFTFAVLFLFNGILNMLTAMIPSFLIIIGSAYPLHYYNAIFRDESAKKSISKPIFLSMLTTAVGFGSFIFVAIPAFREFGFLVSIGLLFDFILTLTVGDELLKRASKNSKKKPRDFGMHFVGTKATWVIVAIVVFALILSPFLISRIKVGLTSTDYFSKKSDINVGYKLLEEKFELRDSIYIVLEKPLGIFLPGDNTNIEKIISDLSNSEYITNVDFPTDLPVTALILASRSQPMLKYYISDAKTIRLAVNLTKSGSENLDEVTKLIEKSLDGLPYEYFLAGVPFIWKAVNDTILENQLQSLFTALLIVFLTIWIVFRNLLEALKLTSPVIIATVLNFVYMSLFGMKLEISTAITSSIIIGLAIDYSIHIGHNYGRTKDIFLTVKNVGPSIIGNAFGIIGGFLTLLIGGELVLFKRVAILVSLGIATATLLTLTMLPLMLMSGRKGKNQTDQSTETIERGKQDA